MTTNLKFIVKLLIVNFELNNGGKSQNRDVGVVICWIHCYNSSPRSSVLSRADVLSNAYYLAIWMNIIGSTKQLNARLQSVSRTWLQILISKNGFWNPISISHGWSELSKVVSFLHIRKKNSLSFEAPWSGSESYYKHLNFE